VLNYARQQRDKLTIQPKSIALDENVSRVVEFWKPLLENKGFEIVTSLNGPQAISADPDAIEQILGNLISNVEKYGNSGKWIAIHTEHDEHNARIIVEDRGPGIPPGKRRTIFEPFERLRSDLSEGVSGTGIGLTISRELAQLHRGSLTVCPNYRDGARFILTLPNIP
jgi:signal transduction histidine kinase